MKTKFTISLIFALMVIVFIFKKPFAEINNDVMISSSEGLDKEFLISVMHSGIDENYTYYPQLGANGWHKYTGPTWGWPGISNDHYDQPASAYRDEVIQRMDSNSNRGFRSVMDRPKIQYLAFGQKSDYQCEDSIRIDHDFWFYSYKNHNIGYDYQDNSSYGTGQWVKKCQVYPDNPGTNPGYVVKDLKANREQANRYWPAWISDSAYAWYVMPRIRIDTSVIGINPNTKVCAVIIHDWNGNTIDSIDILAKNFQNSSNPYSGDYMEEYYFSQPNGPKTAIKIDSSELCPGDRKDFGNWVSDTIKTDFRVYWYGLCDMWIDYVRVENLPAHQLFKGQWDNDIREETQIALHGYNSGNPIPNNFYIEEFEFNIVPAMSYVNSIIQDESNNELSLMVNLNYPLFSVHIPLDNNLHRDEISTEYLNKNLVKKLKPS